ncbi:MAG: hypothetical protein OXC48_02540 [Endozoicomonadaceae bacterium]|nr:hypothetical protein [Endozoicomonadaceae bacterium]
MFEFIPKERIKGVIGDREFIGKHWFHWLTEHNIPFYMRIIDNANTANKKGMEVKVSWLLYVRYQRKEYFMGTKSTLLVPGLPVEN